jgi:hypothetical protein
MTLEKLQELANAANYPTQKEVLEWAVGEIEKQRLMMLAISRVLDELIEVGDFDANVVQGVSNQLIAKYLNGSEQERSKL